MKSKVFFTNLRTRPGFNLLDKLEKLVKRAGIESIDFTNKFVAIKIHFGEPGNLSYIRPNYAARLVKVIKQFGGIPFLTDANTLYKGRRDNAVHHLESAMENGFNPMVTGCPVIIADGLKGTDYREIDIQQKNIKKAKIGTAIADADIVISMNHFKGHEMTCIGGAIKNIGMGSGSIGGKLEMHSSSQPVIATQNCTGCSVCAKNCNHNAISIKNKIAIIDYEKCVGCGQCVAVCRFDAAQVSWDAASATVDEKMAEYTLAVLQGKPSFHINFLMDISPECDCWNVNDAPIVNSIGMLASFDPVALDRACVDLVNQQKPNASSVLAGKTPEQLKDIFVAVHPNTDWRRTLIHAEKIGIGQQDYELITLS